MAEKEKRKYHQKPSFAVFKQNLRSRSPEIHHKYIQKHQCTGIRSALSGISTLTTAEATPKEGHQNYQKQRRINWLKYNILVGIYDNWIRLYPFIQYLLRKNMLYSGSNDIQTHDNSKAVRQKQIYQQYNHQENLKQSQLKQLFISFKDKRAQLLSKLQHQEALNDPKNLQFMKKSQKLARQILSSLPIQNIQWTKSRIQKHNQLIQEMINNFSEQEFAKNSEIIIHSIKERLQFIQEMQQRYTAINGQKKTVLRQKIEMLRKPFKNVMDKLENNINAEISLEQLWLDIRNQRQKEDKKPLLRYLIKKPRSSTFEKLGINNSGRFTVKYKFKKSDYYNQSYIQSKSKDRIKKQRQQYIKTQKQESLSIPKEELNLVPEEGEQESLKSTSSLSEDKEFNKELEQINQACVEAFLRRQKAKQLLPPRQNQTSSIFRPKNTKLQSSNNSLYSPIEVVKIQQSELPYRPSINAGLHVIERQKSFERKASIVKRGSFRRSRKVSSVEELKQEHYSRFKTNKKGGTAKQIRGHEAKNGRNSGELPQSQLSRRDSKYWKQESRKRLNIRRGNFSKKSNQKQQIQVEPAIEEAIPIIQNGNFINQKREIVNYLSKIKTMGLLDADKYKLIRLQTEALLEKCSPSSLLQTRQFANKMVQKTLPCNIPIPIINENHFCFLQHLREAIGKDEQIQMKIKQQFKIYFQESLSYIPEERKHSNEKMVLNSTEMRHLNQQLHRILWFKSENQQIAMAKALVKFKLNLVSRQFPYNSDSYFIEFKISIIAITAANKEKQKMCHYEKIMPKSIFLVVILLLIDCLSISILLSILFIFHNCNIQEDGNYYDQNYAFMQRVLAQYAFPNSLNKLQRTHRADKHRKQEETEQIYSYKRRADFISQT